MSDLAAQPKQEEAPVKAGDMLAGKYQVERVLGVGGMGVVVAAKHIELDQRVALKFLLPSYAARPDIVARFSREARAAAKIRSEHIARVSDVGVLESGAPYIVMEYLEGRDLGDIVEKGEALPVPLAVDYVLQACCALAEAHAAGIVHRDIKPANLFLAQQPDGTEIIKVLDFGVSKSLAAPSASEGGNHPSRAEVALTKTTDVFGSPLYMSPEQLKAARAVDARADIWALGVLFYEVVSRKSPFDAGSVAEVFGAIIYRKPPPLSTALPGAPPGLEAVIDRCLEKEPDARYANVHEFAQALVPFGTSAALAYAQRIARLLHQEATSPSERSSITSAVDVARHAGASAIEQGSQAPSSFAATRPSWEHNADPGKPRARSRPMVIAAGLVVLAGAGASIFAFARPRGPAPTIELASPVDIPPPSAPRESAAPAIPLPLVAARDEAQPAASAPTASAAPATSAKVRRPPAVSPGPIRPKGGVRNEDPNGFGERK
jgi:eukaryotic-like serine/threonine-protein kinase